MIHPTAEVKTKSNGHNTDLWQCTIILEGAVIGANCSVNCHVFIENDVVIGDYVTVKPGVYLWYRIKVDD